MSGSAALELDGDDARDEAHLEGSPDSETIEECVNLGVHRRCRRPGLR